MTHHPAVFCAIDTDDLAQAITLTHAIAPVTGGIKLGLEFFNAQGLAGIEAVINAAPDAAIFLDLKFHDIPNTVAGAVRALSRRFKPAYLNVHAAGGPEMMRAAAEACEPGTKLLAVTMLTSLDEAAIAAVGYKPGLQERVVQMATLSKDSGLAGVVCSSHEITLLREACGPDFALMVPGIRPQGAALGDQKRVMTPREALGLGATHLVIGRPITQAPDPATAASAIIESL